MRRHILLCVLAFWFTAAIGAHAETPVQDKSPPQETPATETDWLECETDSDCTSVTVGCYDWVPVAKDYADDMTDKYGARYCKRSFPAGPKLQVRCENKVCRKARPYSVGDWKQFDLPTRYGQIDDTILSCASTAGIDVTKAERDSLDKIRLPLYRRVQGQIDQGSFSDGQALSFAIHSVVSCDDAVQAIKGLR